MLIKGHACHRSCYTAVLWSSASRGRSGVILLQSALFLAGLYKYISIELIECAAAYRALLYQEFKAVVAYGAVVYLIFPAFPEL